MFKEIPNYNNYLINESGVIIEKSTGNVVRESVNNYGYMYVTLNGNNEFIHDLVAETFLQPIPGFNVIHKDNDSFNNHWTNLEYSDLDDEFTLSNRSHRKYSGTSIHKHRYVNIYEVFNEETGDMIECEGRGAVAELIQYEEISLKNMVGNGRKITFGPYKGYQIRRRK